MSIPKLKKWESIEILWIDSIHTSGWRFEDSADLDDRYLKHKTIGYFFNQSKKAVSVIQSRSDYGDEKCNIDSVMTIPIVAIQKIRRIK